MTSAKQHRDLSSGNSPVPNGKGKKSYQKAVRQADKDGIAIHAKGSNSR